MREIFNQFAYSANSFRHDRNQRLHQRMAIHEVLSLSYLLCQRGGRIIKIYAGD